MKPELTPIVWTVFAPKSKGRNKSEAGGGVKVSLSEVRDMGTKGNIKETWPCKYRFHKSLKLKGKDPW